MVRTIHFELNLLHFSKSETPKGKSGDTNLDKERNAIVAGLK